MKRFLQEFGLLFLAGGLLLVILLFTSASYGQKLDPLERKVDGHVNYNAGKVVDLPIGAGKLFVTLTVSDNWKASQREQQFLSWFSTDRRLVELRSTTNFNTYTQSNPLFRDRLALVVGNDAFPIVTLQRPDGSVVWHVKGANIPSTSGELADWFYESVEAEYAAPTKFNGNSLIVPGGDCPGPGPCPVPTPNQVVAPLEQVVPHKKSDTVSQAFFAVVVVAVGGMFILVNKRAKASVAGPKIF